MLQFGSLAVRGERDPAAPFRKRLEHVAHASKGLHGPQIFRFVKLALGLCHHLALAFIEIWGNELKGLVTVQSGIQLQQFVRDDHPEAGQGFLKA